MLNVIDKCNGHVIQKITHDGKLIRYQTVKAEDIGNTGKVVPSGTLSGAREIAGCGPGGKKLPDFITKAGKLVHGD